MNNWNFVGSLGRDAELKYTPNQKAVASFSVAVTSGYGSNESTTWANCNLWDKQAEALNKFLVKGQKVAISGEVTLRKYTTKDGVEKESLDVRVNSLTLVGAKNSEGNSNPSTSPKDAPKAQESAPSVDFDDDLPFMNPYKFNWRAI